MPFFVIHRLFEIVYYHFKVPKKQQQIENWMETKDEM
jgi:hypothetical protein